jgi:predicted RNA-binding Zn ribbon-like protein
MAVSGRVVLPTRVGGRTCLDFANTVGPRRPGEQARDYLTGFRELVMWGVDAGLLTSAQADRLLKVADRDPRQAVAVHRSGVRLREAIYQVFSAVAQGQQPPADDLGTMQDFYLTALRHARIDSVPGGLAWIWPEDDTLERVLWPVARSAVELAVSGQLTRVKQCPGDSDTCRWLFFDTSKNATRRWCSMRTCGSHLKSQRQSARRRTENKDR